MSIIIGITGSIGVGKSYISKILQDLGIPVIDSDQLTNQILSEDQEVLNQIKYSAPEAVVEDKIDKKILSNLAFEDIILLSMLENLIQPKIAKIREDMIAYHIANQAEFIILDIPLLFEKNLQSLCHYTVTITTSPILQKERVFARPNMNSQKYSQIKKLQLSDEQKVALCDFHIVNNEESKEQLLSILDRIRQKY